MPANASRHGFSYICDKLENTLASSMRANACAGVISGKQRRKEQSFRFFRDKVASYLNFKWINFKFKKEIELVNQPGSVCPGTFISISSESKP